MNKINGSYTYFSGILLLGFGLLLLAMVLSGSLDYYVAPSMHFIVIIGMVFFLLLGLSQIWRSTAKEPTSCTCVADSETKKGKNSTLLLLFLILVIGFILPDYALSTKMAELKGISYTFPLSDERVERNSDFIEEHYTMVAMEVEQNGRLIVQDEMFLDVLALLHLRLDSYIGKEIEFTGFVHDDPSLEKGELAIARFAFTCCVADAIGYGFIVQSAEHSEHLNSGWVTVRGVIQTREYEGRVIPHIDVSEMVSVYQPELPYVYPTLLTGN
ncbi:TIGR03943 family putative permease subunit [Alkalihalobacillus sp. 1P02AB]|uniref:TIGR03943 family putative permease subunit n=1 Tax=Alkalihalobacillus sp. 1P02AB TaxID=3132260 RepID=UPI0039A726E5